MLDNSIVERLVKEGFFEQPSARRLGMTATQAFPCRIGKVLAVRGQNPKTGYGRR